MSLLFQFKTAIHFTSWEATFCGLVVVQCKPVIKTACLISYSHIPLPVILNLEQSDKKKPHLPLLKTYKDVIYCVL